MRLSSTYTKSNWDNPEDICDVYKTITNGIVRLLIKRNGKPERVIRFYRYSGKICKPSEQ